MSALLREQWPIDYHNHTTGPMVSTTEIKIVIGPGRDSNSPGFDPSVLDGFFPDGLPGKFKRAEFVFDPTTSEEGA